MAKINGAYLKELRISHNYTIRGLAEALYVSKTTISNWEQENSLDTLSIVQSLCNLYGIPLDEFVEKGTLGIDSPSIQSEIVISQGEPTENTISIQETKLIQAEDTETHLKKRLHPIRKTGIITFAIGMALLLLFVLAIFLYVFRVDGNSTIGHHTYIFFGIREILWLCFTFLLFPTGTAILVHYFIRRK